MRPRSPMIIAHRGASSHAPENTLAAFQMGIDAGADGVEFDVRLSKDGVPVVIHDRDLQRVAGRCIAVSDLTAEELSSVELTFRGRPVDGASVPPLAQVLDLFGPATGPIHAELKVDKKREIIPLVTAVCDVVSASSVMSRVIVSSFRLSALTEIRSRVPAVKTSALFAPSILRVLKRRRHMISVARAFGADGISPHRTLLTPRFARLAREVGMPLTIWTCQNTKWIDRCSELGIAALMTNDPARMVAYRDEAAKAF